MKNTLTKIFSRHALTNAARIAAIAAACVTMSALTLPKPPSAPPITPPIAPSTKITKPADSADSTDSTQSNFAGGCVGDLNNDHNVDGSDLGSLLSQYGACAGSYSADLNLDGCVDASDLGTLLAQYGSCPNQAQLDWATVLEWNPDPSVIADATVRQKIIDSGFPWRVLDIGTGIEMLLVPADTFQMGASPGDAEAYSWESPTHQVTLSKPFYLGKTEVTQAQWQAKLGNNPSYFGGNPNNPVEQVDWNEIELFNAATGLRLPSEAEWEYACRGGKTTARNGVLNNTDWYDGNNSPWGTKPVAGKLANPYGFYDMLGNVWEWCQDWYGDYSASSVTDPTGPSVGPYGDYKVLRGGFWNSYSTYCRTSYRNGDSPSRRNINIGFRVARTAEYSLSWATVLESLPNAAVVPDAAVRAKIVASGYPWRVLDTGTGIEMLLIPGGTFTMGCSASNSYGCSSIENPTHQVTLSRAFYLGKTEVTQAQWQAKMGNNPSSFKDYSDSPSRPVEKVSWNDIAGFNTATGLRLPSEAEWEYAYRGGTTTAFHSMPGYPDGTNVDSLLGNIAWYYNNSGNTTHAVAGKAANAFGMYDMSGNVWEWCNDWWGSTYYSTSPSMDPAGPSSGSYRVLRGGGWGYISDPCRSSYRDSVGPDPRGYGVGFRVARTP